MSSGIATLRVPLVDKQGHSAYIALGDDELHRWETHYWGLEEGEIYPWAAEAPPVLVSGILGCLFGITLTYTLAPGLSSPSIGAASDQSDGQLLGRE